jgi:hypothetical protein
MPGACVLEGQLHPESLAYAVDTLIARHESLRTVFREDAQGEVRQFVRTPAELQFAIAQQRVPNAGDVRRLVGEEFARPFNLAAGPLLRISLFQPGDGAWVLTYVMHHIISDGWSLNILRDEMLLLYNAHRQGRQNPLPPLRIQYKDYAVWQQSCLLGDALAAHRAYWLRQFAGNLPVLELAKTKVRPAVRTYNGRAITRRVSSAPGKGLKAALQQHGSSLFMGLLSVVYALLHKHTGAEDIIIGSPIAGREHMDLENQIGFYANTLALRTKFGAGYNFGQLLDAVRKTTLDAYEYQLYPFDALVEALQIRRDTSRNVLFDVWVVLQNTDVRKSDWEQPAHGGQPAEPLQVGGYENPAYNISKFDLLFNFVELGEEIQVDIDYNTDIMTAQEAEGLLAAFEKIMVLVAEDAAIPLAEINRRLHAAEKEVQKEHAQQMRMKNLVSLKNKK